MNNYPEAINNILNGHPISALFNVRITNYSAGRIVLGLSARVPQSGSAGALGCIADCVARIAGQESVGTCVVSEYELNAYTQSTAAEFIASAQVESASEQHATYCCEIYAVENAIQIPLAQSQGTLLKIN